MTLAGRQSVAITSMFNTRHGRAVQGCHRNPIRVAQCQMLCSERRSDDGQMVLECAPTGLKSCSDLVLLVELSGLEPLTSCYAMQAAQPRSARLRKALVPSSARILLGTWVPRSCTSPELPAEPRRPSGNRM